MIRRVIWILGLIGFVYVGLCLALYVLQDKMLFPAARSSVQVVAGQTPALPQVDGIDIQKLSLAAGQRFRVAIATPRSKPLAAMLFFPGNGEDLRSGMGWAQTFADYGLLTLVVEYPGYGESEGSASYASWLEAADVAALEVARRAKSQGLRLFLGGSSIGSFSAVHLAAKGYGERLLVAAPPTSVKAVARLSYSYLPIGMLLKHPFNSLLLAPKVKIPCLIIHGDRDQLIPLAMGQELHAAMPQSQLHVAKNCGHNDLFLSRQGPFGTLVEHFLR